MYDWYEVYECPDGPTEKGRYIGATPMREQAEQAAARHNAEVWHGAAGSAWFVRGVRSDGTRVTFL